MMRWLAIASLLVLAPPAAAGEAEVRRLIESKLSGESKLEAVRRIAGTALYEVVVRDAEGPQVFYVDERAAVLIAGQVIDAKTGRNYTEERKRELAATKWESLPLQWAITTVRGSGRRKIAIFSDPNCPFCKRFEKDLAALDDITVHIFLYPVIKPESVPLTKSVWCSKDRAKAWEDLMLLDIRPSAKPDCETPVEKLVALGRRLGANSTPTWFLENGSRYQGAMPLEEVRRLLDSASPKGKK